MIMSCAVRCYKLLEVPRLRALIPFVRTACAQPTSYEWEDRHGRRHQIWQHEGGEQADPLIPLLFCLTVHNPLTAIQDQLRPGECVFAFLDDIYVGAGVELHAGKTRVWNRAGDCPPDMEELGPEVWNAAGIKILGTPVGSAEFEHEVCAARLAEEDKLWKAIKWIPDLQCAWQVPVQCAGPRCHHFLRTIPPSRSAECAVGHDVGMLQAMESVLEGLPGATQISLPMRMGGLGIRSASRLAPSAFWASWADALPMLQDRLPSISKPKSQTFLMGHRRQAAWESFKQPHRCSIATVSSAVQGGRALQGSTSSPSTDPSLESGRHGWHASEHHFRVTVVLAQTCAADQAHLRSHSGAGSSDVLCG